MLFNGTFDMTLMTIEQTATYLQLSRETLYKYVQKGLVPAAKVGRHWRFDKASVDAWISGQTKTAVPHVQTDPKKLAAPLRRLMKVLVVDDDAAIRLLLDNWIRRENHDVDLSKDGTDALERLSTVKYDLVFLDLHMPGLTGGQVLERLRNSEDHPPVVLITGYSESSLLEQALHYDLLYVLSKPFGQDQVRQLIQSVQTAPLRTSLHTATVSETEEQPGFRPRNQACH